MTNTIRHKNRTTYFLRLTKTLDNIGRIDRRSKDWDVQPQFPAGLELRRVVFERAGDFAWTQDRLELRGHFGEIGAHNENFAQLLAHCEPRDGTITERCVAHNTDPSIVLEFLAPPDRVLAAADLWEDSRQPQA